MFLWCTGVSACVQCAGDVVRIPTLHVPTGSITAQGRQRVVLHGVWLGMTIMSSAREAVTWHKSCVMVAHHLRIPTQAPASVPGFPRLTLL
jgi:hypothetical protein